MKRIILLFMGLALSAGLLFGSGFGLFEHGAKATGMAGAFTAQADDPSALFYNPAGIAFQEKSLYVGTTLISPSCEFEGSAPYPGYGAEEEMSSNLFTPSNLTYLHPFNETWTFAVGIYNPFGLATEWEDPATYTGRYISTLAEVEAYRLQPTLAVKPAENFSLALGISYLTANVALEQYLPYVNPYTQGVENVGHVGVDAGLDGDMGFDLGMMYKFNENWTLGVSYHSAVEIEFSGDAEFTQIFTGYTDFDMAVAEAVPFGTVPASTMIEFPAIASIGLATTAIDNWTFEVDINYAGWSSFEELTLEFEGYPELGTTRVSEWEDTYNYRFGMEYRPNDVLFWRGGIVYDENPQPLWDVGPVLPDADRTGYCVGMGYKTGSVTLDVGYMYLSFDKRDTTGVSQDLYYGEYENVAHLLGGALTYHF